VTSAESALNQPANIGADASQSIGRQSSRNNAAMAHYNAGLGYTGLGNKSKAREEFSTALTLLPDYLNAKIALDQL
jgi:Tfp pilus assembly protein PilF